MVGLMVALLVCGVAVLPPIGATAGEGDGSKPGGADDGADNAAIDPAAAAEKTGVTWALVCTQPEELLSLDEQWLRDHGAIDYVKKKGQIYLVWSGELCECWYSGDQWEFPTGDKAMGVARRHEDIVLAGLAASLRRKYSESPKWFVYFNDPGGDRSYLAKVNASGSLDVKSTTDRPGLFDGVAVEGVEAARDGGRWSFTFDLTERAVRAWGGNTDRCSLNGVDLPHGPDKAIDIEIVSEPPEDESIGEPVGEPAEVEETPSAE
jgi:hypothetical protein